MSLFGILGGYAAVNFIAILLTIVGFMQKGDSSVDPDDVKFIQETAFMFPEDFLSRYPHEGQIMRLKTITYLIFNLFVKGYSSVGPEKVWTNYNSDDFGRVLIDAAFYEYLTNFTDRQSKDPVFDFTVKESGRVSNEEIAVDRIGQYLDGLSKPEPQADRFKDVYDILPELEAAECEMQTIIPTSGKPGIHYPNFCDIPKTSFSCDGKRIPGIYADFETGCQAFHVCWIHRIDSFLCPIGTIFNQSLLTCDNWHSTGCYSSPLHHDRDQFLIGGISTELDIPKYDGSCMSLMNKPLQLHTKFMPFKCKVTDVDGNKKAGKKSRDKDSEFQMRLETAYNLVREMLKMLKDIRKELIDEMRSRGTPWIHVYNKNVETNSSPKPSTESIEETNEFTRKLGDTGFKHSKISGKSSSGTKPDPLVSRSTVIQPSKSLGDYLKSSEKQEVPKIVIGSLRLGGDILNEGIIPLTKQVIIDSYRKIESKKH